MEIHFPHLTNDIRATPKPRRLNTPRRRLIATVALVLCATVVTLAACNVGGGGGSNFAFTVTNSPNRIDAITFVNRGSGYAVNDVLTLPGPITGIASQLYDTVTGVTTTEDMR